MLSKITVRNLTANDFNILQILTNLVSSGITKNILMMIDELTMIFVRQHRYNRLLFILRNFVEPVLVPQLQNKGKNIQVNLIYSIFRYYKGL